MVSHATGLCSSTMGALTPTRTAAFATSRQAQHRLLTFSASTILSSHTLCKHSIVVLTSQQRHRHFDLKHNVVFQSLDKHGILLATSSTTSILNFSTDTLEPSTPTSLGSASILSSLTSKTLTLAAQLNRIQENDDEVLFLELEELEKWDEEAVGFRHVAAATQARENRHLHTYRTFIRLNHRQANLSDTEADKLGFSSDHNGSFPLIRQWRM